MCSVFRIQAAVWSGTQGECDPSFGRSLRSALFTGADRGLDAALFYSYHRYMNSAIEGETMKYSKATNYALHTMMYLMAVAPDRPIGVQPLADKMNVSPTYLSKILTKLVKAGLIESASGAHGGYRLKGKKEDVSFLDVIHAVEGTASLFECCGSEDSRCAIHQVMLAAEDAMERHLKNAKLIELAR